MSSCCLLLSQNRCGGRVQAKEFLPCHGGGLLRHLKLHQVSSGCWVCKKEWSKKRRTRCWGKGQLHQKINQYSSPEKYAVAMQLIVTDCRLWFFWNSEAFWNALGWLSVSILKKQAYAKAVKDLFYKRILFLCWLWYFERSGKAEC